MIFKSDRGFLLCCESVVGDSRPILTVEDYIKWYDMYVIYPDTEVVEKLRSNKDRATAFLSVESEFIARYDESAIYDHCFNPKFYVLLAHRLNMEYDDRAAEIIAGRWAIEHGDILAGLID